MKTRYTIEYSKIRDEYFIWDNWKQRSMSEGFTKGGVCCLREKCAKLNWENETLPTILKHKAVKCTCENGYSWITDINPACTDEEIVKYFVGKEFDTAAYPKEELSLCVKCEILPD